MTYDSNNVFAKILRGEIPSVVIPKDPAVDMLDLSPEGAAELIKATQRIAKAVKKALAPPGIMLMQLNGAAAGQSVFHIHFHILPRHAGIDMKLHAREMVDPKTLEPLAAKIRAALDRCNFGDLAKMG